MAGGNPTRTYFIYCKCTLLYDFNQFDTILWPWHAWQKFAFISWQNDPWQGPIFISWVRQATGGPPKGPWWFIICDMSQVMHDRQIEWNHTVHGWVRSLESIQGFHKFVNTQKIFFLCTSAECPTCDAWQLVLTVPRPAKFIPQPMAIIPVQAVGILGAVGCEGRSSRLSHYHETSGLAQTREESVHTTLSRQTAVDLICTHMY